MPRKKVLSENEAHKPLISIERIVYEKAAFKVSKGVLVNLEQYVTYIKDATGDVRWSHFRGHGILLALLPFFAVTQWFFRSLIVRRFEV